MHVLIRSLALVLCFFSQAYSAEIPLSRADVSPSWSKISKAKAGSFYWSTNPIGNTAQLITLNCRECDTTNQTVVDVPLLALLRDSLGSSSPENNRLSYVWLLSAGRFNPAQRILSAVPFFYWRPGTAGLTTASGVPAPLLDLSAPLHPVLAQAGRSILQWTTFDPLAISVRASSRAYQANQADYERLHLEQAIGYLQNAPAASGVNGLSEREIDTAIARLQLRKSMLGGLLINQKVAQFGQQARFADARISSRNFEALRQFAEKTGTYFEPLTLAGDTDSFAILWFPTNTPHPITGTSDKPIWKLLNVSDPWSDPSLAEWHGLSFKRAFDADGRLLPSGASGTRTATLIPLAVYSLSYPAMPLLLIDFRDRNRVHRHEMLQRTITEFTGGVLGLSHFVNWYYYAGAFAYHTVWARRGTATNQTDRLDCYAQFRMKLALDHQLEPSLRGELSQRAGSLNVNPLDSDPVRNISNARRQYARLERASRDNELLNALDQHRRAELAAFGESAKSNAWQTGLHFLSFGTYTHRVSQEDKNLAILDRERRITSELEFLETATANGTDPRIAYDGAQIDAAVSELTGFLAAIESRSVLQRARDTLERVQSLSRETEQTVKSVQPADSAIVMR